MNDKPQTTNAVIAVFMGNTIQDAKQLRYDRSLDLLIPALIKFEEELKTYNMGFPKMITVVSKIDSCWYKIRKGKISEAAQDLSGMIKELPETIAQMLFPSVKLVADPNLSGTNTIRIETGHTH